ncbi:MoaD/ThiS family protein [Natronomonas sp.]|uniref:MoaD/ThiS family protein n=1 Tax=Natronomonas sp. TaxID=2184060 RepID=UPI002FC30DC4
MSTDESSVAEDAAGAHAETTVDVRCTGHIRREVGEHSFSYTFEGTTLRAFLDAFFEEYDVADMLIADTEAEATAHGWVPAEVEAAGDWAKNPEGEQTRAFARVAVNGRFNEHLDGLDTELQEGDRVALMYPFMFCC